MSFATSVQRPELLAEALQRDASPMTGRERLAELLAAGGFILAAAVLWLAQPPSSFALAPAAICFVVLALSSLVRIDTPLGFTVPTQLAFVPLLFAVPVSVVPVAVVLALMAGRLVGVCARRIRLSRLLLTIGNSWFAIGPVAVFELAGTAPRHAGAGLLIGALAAQFGVDFAASVGRVSITDGVSLAAQLRDTWVYAIDAALSGVGLLAAENVHSQPVAALAAVPLLALLAVFSRERRQRLENLVELNNAYRGTALVLGDVVEADDGYTGEHCKGVVGLTLAVADRLGLSPERCRDLEFAALLHDVGKIAIPKEIINKPGKLDPHEWMIIKTHTLEGQRLLDRVGGFMRQVGAIVRSHHERWDGTGYPDGLSGEAIPLESRIIACCDTWNAMRTDRAYRPALSHEVALAELQSGAGSQLDPRLVEVLTEIVAPDRSRAAEPLHAGSALRPGIGEVAGSTAG